MRTKPEPLNFMAIDQYGTTYHNLGVHPRRALQERIGCKHVAKMYRDTKDGSTVQTGYIIGTFWCELYEVKPWRKPA